MLLRNSCWDSPLYSLFLQGADNEEATWEQLLQQQRVYAVMTGGFDDGICDQKNLGRQLCSVNCQVKLHNNRDLTQQESLKT